jgi:hypothetical protein
VKVGLTVSQGHTIGPDTLVTTLFVCVASGTMGDPVTVPIPLSSV